MEKAVYNYAVIIKDGEYYKRWRISILKMENIIIKDGESQSKI